MQPAQRGDNKKYPREIEEQEPKEYLPSDIDSLRNDYRPNNTRNNQQPYRQDLEYSENYNSTKRPTNGQNYEYIQTDTQTKSSQNTRSIYNTYQSPTQDEGYADENDSLERHEKQNTGTYTRGEENLNDVQSLRLTLEDYKKQIALLEVSLYNETLTNEEQRAYIEVLKQALEVRMNDTGLMNFIKQLNHRSGLSETDLFVEINNIKTLSDSLQREKKVNEEKIKEMTKQVEFLSAENARLKEAYSEFAGENQNLSNEMTKMLDTLGLIQSENTKLNQEKDSLLDYIEEMRGRFDQISEENTSQKDTIQNLENKLSSVQEKNRDLSEKFATSEENNYELSIKIEELSKHLGEAHKNHAELEHKASKHFDDHQTHLEKAAVLETNHKELQGEFEKSKKDQANLSKRYDELDKTHKEAIDKLNNSNNQFKDLQSKYDEASNQIRNLNSKVLYAEAEIQEKEGRNQLLIKRLTEFENLQEECDSLRNKIRDLENEVKYHTESHDELKARTDKDRQAKSEEIKVLYDQIASLRSEARAIKDESSLVQGNNDRLELENRHLRDEMERKALILQTQSRELQDLKKSLDQRNEDLHRKTLQNERLESENHDLNRFLEECEQKYQLAFEAKEKMLRDIENLSRENNKYKEQNRILNKTIEDLNTQLRRSVADHEKLVRACDSTEKVLKGVLKDFDSHNVTTPQRGDALEYFAGHVEEQFRDLNHERDILRKKMNDFANEIQFLKSELIRQESKIEKLHQEEKDYQAEIKGLKAETDFLKDDINNLQSKNFKAAQDFERKQEDFERKSRDEEKKFIEKATELEDKITKLVGDKSSLEYLLNQYREVTLNHDINKILDEARAIHNQIANLDREALNIRVKIDMYEAKKNSTSKPASPRKQDSRRFIEELRDKYSEVQANIEIYEAKKRSIEAEFGKIVDIEKQKHKTHLEIEKENKHLRTEIELLLKESELTAPHNKTLETSTYHDILKDMKSLRSEEKPTNISVVSNDSLRRNHKFEKFNTEESTHDTTEKWKYQSNYQTNPAGRYASRDILNDSNYGEYNSSRHKKASLLL